MLGRRWKRVPPLIAAVLGAVGLSGRPALAEEEAGSSGLLSGADVAFDLCVLRPMGLAVFLASSGAFVPIAVLAAPGGRQPLEEAWERFVIAPGDYLWARRLGDF